MTNLGSQVLAQQFMAAISCGKSSGGGGGGGGGGCFIATAAFGYRVMAKDPFTSWLMGLFVFLGFILHLGLDELYSVDFMNNRVKKSFGTALKILDWRRLDKSTALVVVTILAWALTPKSANFWDTLFSLDTYRIIGSRFLR